MLPSPLTRLAAPMALVAGIFIVVAQLMMLPFDPKDHVATSTDPVFQLAGGVYMAGFVALMLALVGAYGWGVHKAGRLGVIAFATAIAGTMLLGGDLWFETFAVPWIADEAPAAFDTDPTIVLAIGAFASYVSFAIGWALFGVASLRSGAFPKTISMAIVVGGILGFQALLAPFGIPIGLAITALGVWMIRSRRSVEARTSGREPAPRTAVRYADPSAVA
jgi:hypothetical protein